MLHDNSIICIKPQQDEKKEMEENEYIKRKKENLLKFDDYLKVIFF